MSAQHTPEQDREDARRYRWLFDDVSMKAIVDAYEAGRAPTETPHTDVLELIIGFHVDKAQIDAIIDAAIAKAGGQA